MSPTQTALILALLTAASPVIANDLPIVPFPKQIVNTKAMPLPLEQGYTIKAPKALLPAAKLFIQDIDDLYNIKGKLVKGDAKASITLRPNKELSKEAYQVSVQADGVTIEAANYHSMLMGITTLTQIVEQGADKKLSIPSCAIKDVPKHSYRAYMLDVARQWNDIETVKQLVDLCRWYKLPYLQLHLADDQIYTFESKAYPQLTEGSKTFYTQEQLKELVDYATQRGVIIIPEFDLPGHSSAMRKKMPELFGESGWGVIDMVNPECVKALQTIAKEMMEVFHTSPYFHIGADEAWLANYQKLPHVIEYIEKNKDKVGGIHDVYLQFVVGMHKFVKAQGKQTLIWESFHGTGSAKVPVPKDMIVMAWETLYERPENLVKNGYTIINATWKPNYMTPGRRWSPEYIYNWNPRLWENHWNAAPSYHNPIQLPDDTQLIGVQMNAWEMIDHEQLLTAHERIAAFSENAWNDEKKQSYEQYEPRAKAADAKIMSLIFPATEERSGFKSACPDRLDHNRINYFSGKASVMLTPLKETDTITYTTDGSRPTAQSTKMTAPLVLEKDTIVKYGMFDEKGEMKAYRTNRYQLRPIDFVHEGVIVSRDKVFIKDVIRSQFTDKVTITMENNMPGTTLHYSTNGKLPTKDSPVYTGPVTIDQEWYDKDLLRKEDGTPIYFKFFAACIDENGKTKGQIISSEYTLVKPK